MGGIDFESSSPNSGNIEKESDVFEFVVKNGHGVKGLADTGLTTVPPRYIHPPQERIDRKDTIDSTPYLGPPIDISGLLELGGENKDEISKTLCAAAEKLGFFQVVNHGVSHEVMENAKRAAHIFFNLPREKKVPYLRENSPCPHVHYGTSFSPEAEKSLEWKDYLSMVYINDDEEVQKFWPTECRDAALAYLKSASKMIHGILSALLRGLGVDIDESTILSYSDARAVNMNFYPPCPNPELTVGVGRHSDLAALTILLQDDIGGLFVKAENKGWIEIPPVEDALVINVGDTLEILSNGKYKSAEHRALASTTRARVSVPIFVSPIPPTTIGPLPGLPEKHGKTVYRQLLFGEYKDNYFKGAHQGKATLDFAKVSN
ncbi:Oxoglutarate/iron-dependent dioxygenase [Macleaya cordata]|uniref:Oxoglutarate/iron-dependent dioxygenase n=1 Tax=Macleaya cordata TaxID=56857 RepID=A0A200QNG3_MACCD|nr:Oxoglutarate/iron-dependent dioxygenase [Macleaya cordata]